MKIILTVFLCLIIPATFAYSQAETKNIESVLDDALKSLNDVALDISPMLDIYTSDLSAEEKMSILAVKNAVGTSLQVTKASIYMSRLQLSQEAITKEDKEILADYYAYASGVLENAKNLLVVETRHMKNADFQGLMQKASKNIIDSKWAQDKLLESVSD